ncbi:MAG TPA: flavin reductase family protein [Geminicoccus sp.]|jgi:flavin reductase (DIM6/NTAB) family NADH-FMN oxidoreductase RutF|uniref:flavin reductase family protein n=1 Tax=Geminicoccus sp. TaxID=2024832 RepID=UPI002E3692EB|nr:flavin reductase family protein [Geminicoccus sp.]HEX2527171.1 flavin reductase family protein [Geminicoccus sp.]
MSKATWMDADSCEARTFRDMLGHFLTGVTVVATRDEEGAARAFTANSFTSVSLDPPLILVCLAKAATCCAAFTRAERFSVNVLGDWQCELSRAFASRGAAKQEALAHLTADEPPVLPDSLAMMACLSRQVVDAGDHVILVGEVERFVSGSGLPLGYHRGSYVRFHARNERRELLLDDRARSAA